MSGDKFHTFLFSHGTTAVKFGFDFLKFEAGDEILLPDYICQSLHHALIAKGITWRYYHVDNAFNPDWSEMRGLIGERTKAAVMVHYFGIPQNIPMFQRFCEKNKLVLIEDNAHGFGSEYEPGKPLGIFGDISICCPWKTLPIYSGGILKLKNMHEDDHFGRVVSEIKRLKRFPVDRFGKIKRPILRMLKFFKQHRQNPPEYWEIETEAENVMPFWRIDKTSEAYLSNMDVPLHRSRRHIHYQRWLEYALQNNLTPVYEKIEPHHSPMLFAAYAKNKDQARRFFIQGWQDRINVRSWPTLPKDLRESQQAENSRRHTLLCYHF